MSAEEHVAVATYLLAGLTGLLAIVTGVSAGFLWAQFSASGYATTPGGRTA